MPSVFPKVYFFGLRSGIKRGLLAETNVSDLRKVKQKQTHSGHF